MRRRGATILWSVLLTAAGCSLAFAAPPVAVPTLSVIGFSEDGSSFAFEQFGTTKNSGETFSELDVFDTASGQAVDGGPFRSIDTRPDATQFGVRRMAYVAAGSKLWTSGVPGVVAVRASGDPADPAAQDVSFDAGSLGPVKLRVRGYGINDSACAAFGSKATALNIKLLGPGDAPMRDLVVERAPPPERLCPTGYAVAEVRLFPRKDQPPILAMIISMQRLIGGTVERRYLGFVTDLARKPPGDAAK